MQHPLDLPGLPFQILLLDLNHIPVTGMIILLLIESVDLAGQLLIFNPGYPLPELLDPRKDIIVFFLCHTMQPVQFCNKMCHKILLTLHLFRLLKIVFRSLPDSFRLYLKSAYDVAPLDLGLVILVLPHIFLQNGLEFLHAVPLLIQLALYRVKKPFLHQTFLVPAVREQLRKSRFLKVHLLNDRLPFLIMDLVLHKLVKILSGLRSIRHIIIEKIHRAILLIRLKYLPARRKILEDHLLLPLLHHRKMVDILDTWFLIFTDDIDHLQILAAAFTALLAPSHHHPRKDIPCSAVQHPLHQDK